LQLLERAVDGAQFVNLAVPFGSRHQSSGHPATVFWLPQANRPLDTGELSQQ
jgi:hypothetical protein